jgi:hypothetical protein
MVDPLARDIAPAFDPDAFARAVRSLRETLARAQNLMLHTNATYATPPTPEGTP